MKKIVTKRENGTMRIQHVNEQPSKTDPSFRSRCNINDIIAKFKKTGQTPNLATRDFAYCDATFSGNLHENLNKIRRAERDFAELPARIRSRFDNDMTKYVEFMSDPKNDEEAVKLGLKTKSQARKDYEAMQKKESKNANSPDKTDSSVGQTDNETVKNVD